MLQKITAAWAGGGSSIPGGTRILPSRINPSTSDNEISAYSVSNIDTTEYIADFRLFPENHAIDRYVEVGLQQQIGKFETEPVHFEGSTPLIGSTNPKESVNIVGYGNKYNNLKKEELKHLTPPQNAVYAYICACKSSDNNYKEATDSGFDPKDINIIGTSSWHYYIGKESLKGQTIIPICIASQGGFDYKKGLRGNKGVQLYVFYKADNRAWYESTNKKPTKITITSHYYPSAIQVIKKDEDSNATNEVDETT